MFKLQRLVTASSAGVSLERPNPFEAEDQQRSDDTSTRANASRGNCQAFERCVFSLAGPTDLAILAQCVP